MFAVIRVRGTQKIRFDIVRTLNMFRLRAVNHCILVPENESFKGMLNKVKDFVTWGEIDESTLEELVKKRGKVTAKKRIAEKDVKAAVKKILAGKIDEAGIKPVFQLAPPKKGWERKGVRKAFKQGGALGYRGKKINDLLKRMV